MIFTSELQCEGTRIEHKFFILFCVNSITGMHMYCGSHTDISDLYFTCKYELCCNVTINSPNLTSRTQVFFGLDLLSLWKIQLTP